MYFKKIIEIQLTYILNIPYMKYILEFLKYR
jgi:hypothetical protein